MKPGGQQKPESVTTHSRLILHQYILEE